MGAWWWCSGVFFSLPYFRAVDVFYCSVNGRKGRGFAFVFFSPFFLFPLFPSQILSLLIDYQTVFWFIIIVLPLTTRLGAGGREVS